VERGKKRLTATSPRSTERGGLLRLARTKKPPVRGDRKKKGGCRPLPSETKRARGGRGQLVGKSSRGAPGRLPDKKSWLWSTEEKTSRRPWAAGRSYFRTQQREKLSSRQDLSISSPSRGKPIRPQEEKVFSSIVRKSAGKNDIIIFLRHPAAGLASHGEKKGP